MPVLALPSPGQISSRRGQCHGPRMYCMLAIATASPIRTHSLIQLDFLGYRDLCPGHFPIYAHLSDEVPDKTLNNGKVLFSSQYLMCWRTLIASYLALLFDSPTPSRMLTPRGGRSIMATGVATAADTSEICFESSSFCASRALSSSSGIV